MDGSKVKYVVQSLKRVQPVEFSGTPRHFSVLTPKQTSTDVTILDYYPSLFLFFLKLLSQPFIVTFSLD